MPCALSQLLCARCSSSYSFCIAWNLYRVRVHRVYSSLSPSETALVPNQLGGGNQPNQHCSDAIMAMPSWGKSSSTGSAPPPPSQHRLSAAGCHRQTCGDFLVYSRVGDWGRVRHSECESGCVHMCCDPLAHTTRWLPQELGGCH